MNDKYDDKGELSLLSMGESDYRISVICPMYNEEIGIERNLDKLLAALNGLDKTSLFLIKVDSSENNHSLDICLCISQPFLLYHF